MRWCRRLKDKVSQAEDNGLDILLTGGIEDTTQYHQGDTRASVGVE